MMKLFKYILEKLGLEKFVSVGTVTNVSVLMTGTFISAIIPILTAPIMTRIFTTADYGIIGIYMSITGLIGVLAFSHYSQAVILAKDHEEARETVWVSLIFSSIIALFTLIIIFIIEILFHKISNSSIGKWNYFIPLSILLNGINAILLLWANRNQQYKQLAGNRLYQAILTAVIQIVLGLAFNSEFGLMFGLLIGQLFSAILLIFQFRPGKVFELGSPNINNLNFILKKYKKLLIFSTPSEFMNNLIGQIPIFLLQKFGGLNYVGSFNFTQRLLGLPQTFISSAFIDIFKQKASAQYNIDGNCKGIFEKTAKVLVLLAIVPFAVLSFSAPTIFKIIFGIQWEEAGIFAQYLSITFFLRFIVSPLSYTYIIAGKYKEDFIIHIIFLIITVGSFYLSNYFFQDKRLMILVYSLVYSLVYVFTFLRSYKFSKGQL